MDQITRYNLLLKPSEKSPSSSHVDFTKRMNFGRPRSSQPSIRVAFVSPKKEKQRKLINKEEILAPLAAAGSDDTSGNSRPQAGPDQ